LIEPLYHTMPKLIGPPSREDLPPILKAALNFTSDGRVRRERHVLPNLTPGVALSRLYVKAIDPVTGKIRPELRAQLLAAVPAPSNWAARITALTVGHSRAHWAADEAAYNALTSAQRADWIYAAGYTGIEEVWLRDTHHTTHRVSAGRAFFHVATGIYRIGLLDQPGQPAASNANAWAQFMFAEEIVYPTDALTLGTNVISLGEEILTQ
jgi:hypothetical protein